MEIMSLIQVNINLKKDYGNKTFKPKPNTSKPDRLGSKTAPINDLQVNNIFILRTSILKLRVKII
jgi:hypothetical protein